jgi:hypothetical protein
MGGAPMMPRAASLCPNFNHRRSDAPVRHCPSCGEVVNAKVAAIRCATVKHDARRKGGSAFCIDCGERLAPRP